MTTVQLSLMAGISALVLSFQSQCWAAQNSPNNNNNHLAHHALQECERGRAAADRETRLAHFEQGQRLGEQAVASDERNAEAHFALFCNLGEQLRVDGESLTSIFAFRRMMKELDRVLELDPSHLDALSAKGTLLVKLPPILGGDLEKGEQLLEQVVQRAPKAVNARLALAKIRYQQGRHDEAVKLASDALAIARTYKRTTFIAEAEAVLEQLRNHVSSGTSVTYAPRF